jgi:hypothetical protein
MKNKNLVVVDIQPQYSSFISYVVYDNLAGLIKNHDNIIWYFNGLDVGIDDQPQDIKYMMYEYIDEEDLDKIKFVEKSYAFFRNRMDRGDDRSDILKTLNEMNKNNINDSRELDNDEGGFMYIPDIFIPDYKSTNICGGGDRECLAEMEIFFSLNKIKTKRMNGAIY